MLHEDALDCLILDLFFESVWWSCSWMLSKSSSMAITYVACRRTQVCKYVGEKSVIPNRPVYMYVWVLQMCCCSCWKGFMVFIKALATIAIRHVYNVSLIQVRLISSLHAGRFGTWYLYKCQTHIRILILTGFYKVSGLFLVSLLHISFLCPWEKWRWSLVHVSGAVLGLRLCLQ